MGTKEIVDAIFRFLELLISWPTIFIIVALLVRRELPTLLSKLADRITKAPGGFEFAALQEKVQDLNDQVAQLKETINFKPSNALTPQIQKELQNTLDLFRQYLKKIGFPISEGQVDIEVRANEPFPHYEGSKRLIVVSAEFAEEPYVSLREYMHHALTVSQNLESYQRWPPILMSIESGLADYFSGSYVDNPILGEKASKYYATLTNQAFNKPYIRNIKNARKFTEKTTASQDEGEIWGGAFWDIRELLGQTAADKLLFLTWQALQQNELADPTGNCFVSRLLTLVPNVVDKTSVASVRKIFRSRSLAGTY